MAPSAENQMTMSNIGNLFPAVVSSGLDRAAIKQHLRKVEEVPPISDSDTIRCIGDCFRAMLPKQEPDLKE